MTEQDAKKALEKVHQFTTLCADEHEEHIWNCGFIEGAKAQEQVDVELIWTVCMYVVNRISNVEQKDFSDVATEAYRQILEKKGLLTQNNEKR